MATNKIEVEGLPAINGGIASAILTEKKPVFPYTDGKRSSEVPTAWRIGVPTWQPL